MIIVKILGGLGNQMFQYAAAKAIAKIHNAEIKFDISELKNDALRKFDLDKLRIDSNVATKQEIKRWKAVTPLERIHQRLIPYRSRHFYKQPYFHYDGNFKLLGDNVYIQGYFQSQKYFVSVEEEIRQQYDFHEAASKDVHTFVNILRQEQSVAIHIRKGDYKNVEMMKVHGILPDSYYRQATEFFKEKLSNPTFYLFSDDAEIVNRNFTSIKCEAVSGQVSCNHFDDMFLMSQCKHNIIANSSFSWWAAWLNPNPHKIVIAPKKWFNDGPKDTHDLLPESWIQL